MQEVEEVESRPGVGVGERRAAAGAGEREAGSGARLRGQSSPAEPLLDVCAVRTSAEWDEQAQAHLPRWSLLGMLGRPVLDWEWG